MFDAEFGVKLAQWHALGAELAAAADSQLSGAQADLCLAEALGGTRQGELLTCRLIERADRTGEFAADGAVSAAAYVRGKSNERPGWASKRVLAGRALTDRLPLTAKVWEAGRLGLDHAAVIDQVTRDLRDPALVGELDRILSEAAADGLTPGDMEKLAEQVRAQLAPEQAA